MSKKQSSLQEIPEAKKVISETNLLVSIALIVYIIIIIDNYLILIIIIFYILLYKAIKTKEKNPRFYCDACKKVQHIDKEVVNRYTPKCCKYISIIIIVLLCVILSTAVVYWKSNL